MASVVDATEAMQAVSTVNNSERVSFSKKGRIENTASTPTKILLETLNASAPERRINLWNTFAKHRTTG